MFWHYGGPWWGMMGYAWGWHMAVGALFWLGFLVLVVVAMQRFRNGGSGGQESALTLLKERYARGEIGRDEFLEKQRDLAAPGGKAV